MIIHIILYSNEEIGRKSDSIIKMQSNMFTLYLDTFKLVCIRRVVKDLKHFENNCAGRKFCVGNIRMQMLTREVCQHYSNPLSCARGAADVSASACDS